MSGPPEPVYCRTCARALNIRTPGPGGPVEYLHAAQLRGERVDHRADPVPLSELGAAALMVCDACSTPRPSYVYVFGEQTTTHDPVTRRVVGHHDYLTRHSAARTRRVTTTPGITQSWGERWALCRVCADHVDRRDVLGLVARVCDAMPAKYTRGNRLVRVRGELHATYSHLIATRQPGRGAITAEHPLGVWADDEQDHQSVSTDPTPTGPPPQRWDRFRTKFPAKAFDSQGRHTGPGPWLDLIGEACAVCPGFFGAPLSLGPWWAGGSVEEYAHARVIHHLDDSVSVVALDDRGDRVLTQADTALRARHQPTPPARSTAHTTAADPTGSEKGQQV